MNAYPVRLAAGLALMALCALAEESPNAKMAEPQTKPAIARKIPPDEAGVKDQPVQLPTQVVDGLRNHMDHVSRDLDQAVQREAMTARHSAFQKALTKNTEVDLLGILLVAQKMMDSRVDAIPGTRDQAALPPGEGGNHVVAVPIVRSSW
jgi:hypothetical protein